MPVAYQNYAQPVYAALDFSYNNAMDDYPEIDYAFVAGERPYLDWAAVYHRVQVFEHTNTPPPIQMETKDGDIRERYTPSQARRLANFLLTHGEQGIEQSKRRHPASRILSRFHREPRHVHSFSEQAARWLLAAADADEIIFVREVPIDQIHITPIEETD